MTSTHSNLSRFQPMLLSVLRIASAYMFMLHGTAKLFALPHIEMFDGLQLMSIYGLAGILDSETIIRDDFVSNNPHHENKEHTT